MTAYLSYPISPAVMRFVHAVEAFELGMEEDSLRCTYYVEEDFWAKTSKAEKRTGALERTMNKNGFTRTYNKNGAIYVVKPWSWNRQYNYEDSGCTTDYKWAASAGVEVTDTRSGEKIYEKTANACGLFFKVNLNHLLSKSVEKFICPEK